MKLETIEINLTDDGVKRATEAFTDFAKGVDEIQSAKFNKWLKEYCDHPTEKGGVE
jgi:hypothetical protein